MYNSFIGLYFIDPLEQFRVFNALGKFTLLSGFTNVVWFYCLFFFVFYMFFGFKVGSFLIPNNYALFTFKFYYFVRKIIEENISMLRPKYFLFIVYLYYFIAISNLSGMVPYSFTLTSHISITFVVAFIAFLAVNLVGLNANSFSFILLFLPGGTPLPIMPFLIIIEVISYIARVFSLSIRLFANMMSGHTLLKILSTFAWISFFAVNDLTAIIAPVLLLTIVLIVVCLELVISALQAYVFIVLVAIYLNDALNPH